MGKYGPEKTPYLDIFRTVHASHTVRNSIPLLAFYKADIKPWVTLRLSLVIITKAAGCRPVKLLETGFHPMPLCLKEYLFIKHLGLLLLNWTFS